MWSSSLRPSRLSPLVAIMDLDVLKVKFTHSNTVRDKKPYTIYEIEVRSSSTITWVIYKRYSSFHQLHQDLIKAPSISPEMKLNLPQLPPKRSERTCRRGEATAGGSWFNEASLIASVCC